MTTSDELADALFDPEAVGELQGFFSQDELRTLARDAAKQALLDAAKMILHKQHPESVRLMLRARAEQIGEGK